MLMTELLTKHSYIDQVSGDFVSRSLSFYKICCVTYKSEVFSRPFTRRSAKFVPHHKN